MLTSPCSLTGPFLVLLIENLAIINVHFALFLFVKWHSVISHIRHIFTPRKEHLSGAALTNEVKACRCRVKELYPLHSHQSTTPLNQTGPTTDTYGAIWHIHFARSLCRSLKPTICKNQTEQLDVRQSD